MLFSGGRDFAGITALVELPKNCVAAAMDKEISKKKIQKVNKYKTSEKLCPFFFESDLQVDRLHRLLYISG